MGKCWFRKCQWHNIASYHGNSTGYKSGKGITHHMMFAICKRCEKRVCYSIDPNDEDYETHPNVLRQTRVWEDNCMISVANLNELTWYDTSYATEQQKGAMILELLKKDKKLSKLINDNPTVQDAFDNLEAVVNLSFNL